MRINETLKFFDGLPPEVVRDSQENLRKLLGFWQDKSVTPFLGAGASKPYGYLEWTEYIRKLAEDAKCKQEAETLICAGRYEEAAEAIVLRFGQREIERRSLANVPLDEVHATGERVLSGYLSRDFKRALHPEFKGVMALLPRLAIGPVVTTNFDHVLEEAYEFAGVPFKNAFWGDLIPSSIQAILRERRHILLKVHGDVDEHMRVLTLTQYAQYYGSTNPIEIVWTRPLPQALEYIFTRTNVVFIGCSLNNDRTVEVLRQLHLSPQGPLAALAFVEWPTSAEEFDRKNEVFATSGIRPIWYPTHRHETIELILGYIAGEVRQWRGWWFVLVGLALVVGAALGMLGTEYFARSPVVSRPLISQVTVDESAGMIEFDVSYINAKARDTSLSVTKLGVGVTSPVTVLSANGTEKIRVPSDSLGSSDELEICLITQVPVESTRRPAAIESQPERFCRPYRRSNSR